MLFLKKLGVFAVFCFVCVSKTGMTETPVSSLGFKKQEYFQKMEAAERQRKTLDTDVIQLKELMKQNSLEMDYLKDEFSKYVQQQVMYTQDLNDYTKKVEQISREKALKLKGVSDTEVKLRLLKELEENQQHKETKELKDRLEEEKKALETQLDYLEKRNMFYTAKREEYQKQYETLKKRRQELNDQYLQAKFEYELLLRQEGE